VEQNKPTYMIWDEFSVHMKKQIVHHMQNLGTQVDVIPGGYTGKIQILDKGINKPFKEKVQAADIEWLLVNNGKPKRKDVAMWIKQAWDQITVETITNTWVSVFGEV